MQSCLETTAEKVDVILFQESWIFTTVLYSSFYSITSSESDLESWVYAFIVQKSAELFTSRLNIYQNSDI